MKKGSHCGNLFDIASKVEESHYEEAYFIVEFTDSSTNCGYRHSYAKCNQCGNNFFIKSRVEDTHNKEVKQLENEKMHRTMFLD